MTRRKRYQSATSAYVSARTPLGELWAALLDAVGRVFRPPPRTPHAHSVQRVPPQPAQPGANYYPGVPAHALRVRKAGAEAERLLARLLAGKPVSRRECQRAGMTQGGWQRARGILQRAGVTSRYDGRLLVDRREARALLKLYLREVEIRCRVNNTYIPP